MTGFGYQAADLAIVPTHADDQGRHPVVIVDSNEEVFIEPIASTLSRALELVVDDQIRRSQEHGWPGEPFPEHFVERIAADTRLMELIADDAFARFENELDREWLDLLRSAAPAR